MHAPVSSNNKQYYELNIEEFNKSFFFHAVLCNWTVYFTFSIFLIYFLNLWMMATIETNSFYKKDVSCQLLLHKEQYHLKYMLPTPHLPKLKGEYSRFYSQINVFFVKYLYSYRQERKYQNILRGHHYWRKKRPCCGINFILIRSCYV